MKTVVSEELRSRLRNAAANGSMIASDILSELKQGKEHPETIRGNADYFSTKRVKGTSDDIARMKIMFTVCLKDVANEHFPDRGNPQAPWFRENRTDIEPSTFVKYFKNLPEYDDREMKFFTSAICVEGKVSVKLHQGMNDFIEAYDESNYIPYAQPGESPLHRSCMRNEDTVGNLADFYHNFAGAKIIVARDQAGCVLGRAVVWGNVLYKDELGRENTVSVLDRIYYSHDFVIDKIRKYAENTGIKLRKTFNTSSSQQSFTALNRCECLGLEKGDEIENLSLRVHVPASKWHKEGAPYLDTFCYLTVKPDMDFELSNAQSPTIIAKLNGTNGYAGAYNKLCPFCGMVHNGSSWDICKTCKQKFYTDTAFGEVIQCKTILYRGEKYPSALFTKNRSPKPPLAIYLKIQKLFDV